jgi:hypothetical protein
VPIDVGGEFLLECNQVEVFLIGHTQPLADQEGTLTSSFCAVRDWQGFHNAIAVNKAD